MLDPSTWRLIDWPTDDPPMIVVVVDTEAEFDWARQQPRRAMGVTSVKRQAQTLPIFERYGVRPTLVLDYPVSSTPEGYEFIRDLHRSGACEIGAHLQPWDNPPFVEQTTDENSYPGNLPFELERDKLVRLTRTIADNIGVRPRIYKAGRYGVGHATAQILAELGYEIDVSVVPGTDLRRKFGPDFSHCGARPYWFGADPALLEIPLSIGYTGLLAPSGPMAYVLTMNERLKALHVPGILARLGLVERITLDPRGHLLCRAAPTDPALLRSGQRVFSFTYHSPSLAPGNTPYVRSEADLRAFLRRIEQYLDFFMGELGGRAATPFEIKALAQRRSPAPCAGAEARQAPMETSRTPSHRRGGSNAALPRRNPPTRTPITPTQPGRGVRAQRARLAAIGISDARFQPLAAAPNPPPGSALSRYCGKGWLARRKLRAAPPPDRRDRPCSPKPRQRRLAGRAAAARRGPAAAWFGAIRETIFPSTR